MRQADHPMQVVYFGGRYFIEGMLSFGGMNSPAIYNLPASYLILLAQEDSKLDKRLSIQQLGRLGINYILVLNAWASIIYWC